MLQSLERFVPSVRTVRTYDRADLRGDLFGGLTTAIMLIPQGMAYAMLAGLPPIVGLYASTVPLVLYALFGTSRQLAVGPVAMVSLLVAAGVGAVAEPGSDEFISFAVLLALMVGVLQTGMGLLKMGFLVNFLSHPVISGFTSAAALIIGLSQLKHLLGVDIPRGRIDTVLLSAAEQLGDVHLGTLAIGLAAIACLVTMKKKAPRLPAALAVVVASTAAVWGFGLADAGVQIVGDVPDGLPPLTLPEVSMDAMSALLPIALTIALVGFMESISVAKAFARKHSYDVEPSQELVGLGVANLGSALFGGYPVTGGFSRTAVNDQAGARTPLAAIVTAALVAVTLAFLTPLFHFLPKAVLAAIVMVAVFGLIDTHEVKHLWKVKRSDLALLGLTFVSTLALGIEEGILVGVGASMLWFVVKTTRPHFAVLGRLPGSDNYRNIRNFPEAQTTPGVVALRVDAPFYFGNVTFLKDTVRRLEAEVRAGGETLRALVLDASAMNQLDSSADQALHELVTEHEERDVAVFISGVKGPVRDVMKRSGLWRRLGDRVTHLRVHDAMLAAAALSGDAPTCRERSVLAPAGDDPSDRPVTSAAAA